MWTINISPKVLNKTIQDYPRICQLKSTMQKIPCTVQILTRNSQDTLERCLESVKDFAEIIVLDGNSTDRTLEVACAYGCTILKQYDTPESLVRIHDFSEVRNRGLASAHNDWFMFIDSDEYLSSEAVEEVRGIVTNLNPLAQAWWQPRLYVLNGKVIDCATTYPNMQIRLFNRKWAHGFIKPIHERVHLKPGAVVGTLRGVEYVPLGTLEDLKGRWEHYLDAEEAMHRASPRHKLAKLSFRHTGILIRYCLRYIRIVLFCRGNRLPLHYEFVRHSYTARMVWRYTRLFFIPWKNKK